MWRRCETRLGEMIVTEEYARRKFREYNGLIFGGRLPEIAIQLSRSRKCAGMYVRSFERRGWRKVYTGESLRFSVVFDLEPAELDDVIIHEMIHYYIAWAGIRDTGPHGREFLRIMNGINARYGRHVSVSSHEALPLNEQAAARRSFVCLARLGDGRVAYAVVATTRIFSFDREVMRHFPQVKSIEWYSTVDPYFSLHPRTRVIRLAVPADQEAFLRRLSTAVRFVRDGKVMRPA